MIGALITLIVYLLVLGLLFWLVQYLLGVFPLADPFARVIRALMAVLAVLLVIAVLLDVFGLYGTGLPRLRAF